MSQLKTFTNPCVRCGRERIFSKRWKEYVGKSLVVYTTNVCPDAECQKEVEAKLKDKKDHFETMQANSLKRRAENKRNKKLERKTS